VWPFFLTRTLLWLLWSATDRIDSASLSLSLSRFFFGGGVKYYAFTLLCLEEQRIHTVVKIGNNKTVEIRGVTFQFPKHCRFTWLAYACTCHDSCHAQGSKRRDTL
jgi:hypothetical protein